MTSRHWPWHKALQQPSKLSLVPTVCSAPAPGWQGWHMAAGHAPKGHAAKHTQRCAMRLCSTLSPYNGCSIFLPICPRALLCYSVCLLQPLTKWRRLHYAASSAAPAPNTLVRPRGSAAHHLVHGTFGWEVSGEGRRDITVLPFACRVCQRKKAINPPDHWHFSERVVELKLTWPCSCKMSVWFIATYS